MKFRGKALEDNKLHVLRSDRPPEDRVVPTGPFPRPRFNWKLRALVPGLVLGGFALLLGLAAYEELLPTSSARVAGHTETSGGQRQGAVTVQAAGWLEADPYKSYVTALTDGKCESIGSRRGDRESGPGGRTSRGRRFKPCMQRAHDKVIEQEAILNVEKANCRLRLRSGRTRLSVNERWTSAKAHGGDESNTAADSLEIAMKSQTSSTPRAGMIGPWDCTHRERLEQEFVRLRCNTTHRFQT